MKYLKNFKKFNESVDVGGTAITAADYHSDFKSKHGVSKETTSDLRIPQISKKNDDDKYFFTKKVINEIYDTHIFHAEAKTVEMINDSVKFNLTITYRMKEYEMYVMYMPDEVVIYGPHKKVGEMRKELGNQNMELFNQLTYKMINDHIPIDFWEVRISNN